MEYGKIIAVTGLPGLFELLSSKNDGAIVRSLEDKSTKFVSSRVHNFSHLESIEVFTVRENVNLIDIFHAMEKDGSKVPDGKDAGALRAYFEKVYPDLDFGRVYSSDLKKMAKWFEVLKSNNVELKLTEREEEPEAEEAAAPAVDEAATAAESSDEEKKPAKKAKAPVKSAANDSAKEAAETEKPKKSAPKKKAEPKAASEDKEEKKTAKAPAKKSAPKKK
jgi:hypothetical protein